VKRRPLIIALLLSVATIAIPAYAALRSYGGAHVRFKVGGPAGMTIEGKADELTASEKDNVLTVVVPLSHLKTGMALRDKHLRGYLNTKKYPNATLAIARSALQMPADKKSINGKATGRLTLHGKTREVPFTYKASNRNNQYRVQGKTKLDIREFGIEVPCYLGVCTKPEVDVDVRFFLRER
jgi:polyisoprenoid-binding protein YceI